MTLGLLLTARCGSSRLPVKHLRPAAGRPVLSWLIGRIRHAFAPDIAAGAARVAIATGDEPANRALERAFGHEAEVFYGSPHNIPLRHLQAAAHLGLDRLVAVDGDDILCSPAAMRAVADALAGAGVVRTERLPFGMNVMGYTRAALEEALAGRAEQTLETGWGRIFPPDRVLSLAEPSGVGDARLRFTLDYEEDLTFFAAVLDALGPRALTAGDDEITELVVRGELYRINAGRVEEYWEAFRRGRDGEQGA